MPQLTPLHPSRPGRRIPAKRPPAARKPPFAASGRAWINGNEVGGTDPRYAHLNRSYD